MMCSARTLVTLCLFLILAGCSSPPLTDEMLTYREAEEKRVAAMLASRPKIVIDAGHGGQDHGAVSKSTPCCQEKEMNLKTVLILNAFLEKMGYQTILTRGSDYFVPLDLRTSIANSNQAALFISVHYNSAPNVKAEGVEVYYFDAEENTERTKDSRQLACKVLERIVDSTECKSRGVKKGGFAVIREAAMPAILVEGGFITNQNELQKIKSPSYMKSLAGGIALGIHDFLKEKKISQNNQN